MSAIKNGSAQPFSEIPVADQVASQLKPGSLGIVGVAFFVLASAAPMAAFVGAGPILFSFIGPGVPLVYLMIAAVVAIFAIGYLKMSKHIRSAAGFVAYIDRGLGKRAATAASGIVIVTYIALQVGLWAQFGVFAEQLVSTYLGVSIPPWAWCLVFIAIVTALTMRGVDLSLRVLGVLLTLEIVVVLVLVGGILFQSGGKDLSAESFSPAVLTNPSLGIAMLFVLTCFTTFEATTVFAEEARRPERTIPRALFAVIGFIAVFYGVATWAVSVGVGPDQVQQAAADDLAGLMFGLATTYVGPWLDVTMQVLVVLSFVAMLLGMANMFARYCFGLARARVLPEGLAVVTHTRKAPARGALVNGIVVALILVPLLFSGADPMVVVYAWFVALGTVGFLAIMSLASVAIIAYFVRREHRAGSSILTTLVAPIVAFVLVTSMLVFTIANFDALLLDGNMGARWLLLALPVALVIGFALPSFRRGISFTRGVSPDLPFEERHHAPGTEPGASTPHLTTAADSSSAVPDLAATTPATPTRTEGTSK